MNVTLTVARIAERVTVIAEGLMADPVKVGVSISYGSEYIQNIPRQRSDVLDFIKIAPGISATRPSSVHSPYVSTFGSGVGAGRVALGPAILITTAYGPVHPSDRPIVRKSLHTHQVVALVAIDISTQPSLSVRKRPQSNNHGSELEFLAR